MYLLKAYQVQKCTYPVGTKMYLLPGTKVHLEQRPFNRDHFNREQTLTETILDLNRSYPSEGYFLYGDDYVDKLIIEYWLFKDTVIRVYRKVVTE